MSVRTFLIIAAVVLVSAIAAILFLQQDTPVPPSIPEPVAAATPAPLPTVSPRASQPPRAAAKPQPARTIAVATPPPITEGEKKIAAILEMNPEGTEEGNRATVQMLLSLLPTLKKDEQSEAAQHISNLLVDADYSRVLPIVKNPQAAEEVLDVFVTDLMNRSDAVKLPTLLEIAKIPNHPHREEAMTDLQIFLDEDFNTDWPKWETALKAYLKKQAEEEAAEETAAAAAQPQ